MILKRINLLLCCCLVLFIVSCKDQPATYNVTTSNFPPNSVIQIQDETSDKIISTSNIQKEFSFTVHDSKERYGSLMISGPGINNFYWMYIKPGTHTINLDASKLAFPFSAEIQENKEIADYYAIHKSMSKMVEDSAAIATNNFNNATRENIAEMLAKTKAWDEKVASLQVDIVKAFATKYPSSHFTPLLLLKSPYVESNPLGYKKVMELTTKDVQKSKAGLEIMTVINNLTSTLPGSIMPDIEGTDPSGKPFNTSLLKKVNVVICWISYNNIVRREHSNLISLYKKYKPLNVEFIGVSFDKSKKNWLDIIKADQLPWLQYTDLLGAKSPNASLSNRNVPYVFIIDQHKKILANGIPLGNIETELANFVKH